MVARSQRVSVLVADDHPIYREGIVRAIKERPDLELVGEAGDGRKALDEIKGLVPGVAGVDIRMPGAEGAKGYLSKESSRQEICDAIVTVARGGTALAAAVQAGLASEIQQRERTDGRPDLTPRESEVLHMIADGLSAPEIAKRIHLSPTTVKTHLHTLYEKLGVSD